MTCKLYETTEGLDCYQSFTSSQAFGGSLANLQTVSHKLAEMKTDICVARAFVDQCIAQHADHKLDSATGEYEAALHSSSVRHGELKRIVMGYSPSF